MPAEVSLQEASLLVEDPVAGVRERLHEEASPQGASPGELELEVLEDPLIA